MFLEDGDIPWDALTFITGEVRQLNVHVHVHVHVRIHLHTCIRVQAVYLYMYMYNYFTNNTLLIPDV